MTLRLRTVGLAAGFLSCLATGATFAGTPYEAKAVCPVDDQTFTYTGTMSYSTWGSALDGMPQASWTTPMPIPQCPESRFPVYRDDFSEADKAKIRALVATPEYQAVKDEASYYLMWFVLGRIEPPREGMDRPWPILQASWQVIDDPARYAAYAAILIPLMDAELPALRETSEPDWWYFQIVLANVSRQSGDLAAASARLDSLPENPPRVGDLEKRLEMTRSLIANADRSQAVPEKPPSD